MTSTRMNLVALMWLIPTAALAQGAIGFAADPNLHVNPNLKDCSVQFAPELTQAAFARFTREFGSVSAFKMTSPPATLGKGHVSFGLEEMSFSVEEKSDAWNDTFYHPNDEHPLGATHNFPKLRLRAGVTDHLDIGAFYTANANANYGWFGLEAKYGLLRQGEETPISLALRGAYTKTLYVDDMSMDAVTADVAAGRTFRGWFTPYLGVGADAVLARETSNAVALQDEKHVVPHALGGLEVRLWHVALGAEGYLSELNSVQMQVTALF